MANFKAWAVLGAAAVATWAGAPPARADSAWTQTPLSAFSACDGFGMPSSGGDGMTNYAMVWGIFNPPGYGTTARGDSAQSAAGIASCDAALADSHLKADYWMRRVNLLKARALHRLETGDAAGALNDLELARQAVQDGSDPFYQRSLGLGLDFVRAYALRRTGDVDGGAKLAREAWRQRPWTRLSGYAALIALGSSAEDPENRPLMQGLARLQPALLNDMFARAFETGQWSEVVDLYPQQLTPLRRRSAGYGGSVFETDYLDRVEEEIFWASRSGGEAFALASLGRAEEARAALAAAQSRLTKALEPPEPPPPLPEPPANARSFKNQPTPEIDKRKRAEAETRYRDRLAENTRISARARPALDVWTKLVERRIAMDTAPVADLLAGLSTSPLPRGSAGLSMVRALEARATAADRPALAALHKQLDVAPAPRPEMGVSEFFRALPDAETQGRLTPYKQRSYNFWTGSDNGFTVKAVTSTDGLGLNDEGVISVSFRGVESPAAVVEELALLQAADLARGKGLKGFIIVRRYDIRHTISTTQYGMVLRSDPAGYETQFYIVPVDPLNLPARYRGSPWRVIDADTVWNALSPIYVRPDAGKNPKKN
jgi:hypothetical protein